MIPFDTLADSLSRIDEEILTDERSDEALEAAAVTNRGRNETGPTHLPFGHCGC